VSKIADSNALKDPGRMLTQHQAVLTLLQARISNPQVRALSWLDLACGRGQIIAALQENLSNSGRAKIAYHGYDVEHHYTQETKRLAEKLGLASTTVMVGELSNFNRIIPGDKVFEFITLTNTIHELAPASLPELLVDTALRLSDSGTLFIYDMESLTPPELGAVPWRRDEVRQLVDVLLRPLGADSYQPEVGKWTHRTCLGWNVLLERVHIPLPTAELKMRRDGAVQSVQVQVSTILNSKLNTCRDALESLTLCGTDTAEEGDNREQLLHEFWAVPRALERRS
jgi:hypothetical protein